MHVYLPCYDSYINCFEQNMFSLLKMMQSFMIMIFLDNYLNLHNHYFDRDIDKSKIHVKSMSKSKQ